jgi:hypothetical protein
MQNAKCKMQNGFSLISVLVAASLLGGLSMVMMQMAKQSTKSTAKMNFDTEVSQITNEINGILSDPTSCVNTITQTSLTYIKKYIPNNPTPVNKYDTTQGPYGNGSVKIDSYVLNLTGADAPNLQINFQNKAILKNQSGSNALVTKIVKLDVTYLGTPTVANITSCRSVSTATDTMWNRQAGSLGNIFYNSGNVGIGKSAPSRALHVGSPSSTNLAIAGNNAYIPAGLEFVDDGQVTAGKVKEWAIWHGRDGGTWLSGLGFHRYDAVNPCTTGTICNISMFLHDNGNVVIGGALTNPTTTLEVLGEVKIGSTGVACSAANEGALKYNFTSKNMEFCNGIAWTAVGGTASWNPSLAVTRTVVSPVGYAATCASNEVLVGCWFDDGQGRIQPTLAAGRVCGGNSGGTFVAVCVK